jgi:uroporphyrin-III C-methyltransferase/precorrin-2 dehydrogenase/sirohydrochlorin ferrochelatase
VTKVYLIGAGPGDPSLITVKGRRILETADVVLYDHLAPAALLHLAPAHAERIYVGKKKSAHAFTQDQICAMLIERALQGRTVVRLKGGDPFIFGRGGEELQALAAAQIAYSVVPGITAAAGCAAYAGIPLTHRDYAHSVSFVAGHARSDGQEPDWRALASPGATAVFYMGLARLEHIVQQLMEHGAEPARPAAIIAQGTTAQQRVIAATLATLGRVSADANLESPALLVVGDVVALHSTLAWFNTGSAQDLSQTA